MSPELSPEKLFELVCEAAFRDGRIEEWESQLIRELALFLHLGQETALEIYRSARQAREREGADRSARQPDKAVYEQVVACIMEDGEIDNLESGVIRGLRRVLGVTDADHDAIVARLESR